MGDQTVNSYIYSPPAASSARKLCFYSAFTHPLLIQGFLLLNYSNSSSIDRSAQNHIMDVSTGDIDAPHSMGTTIIGVTYNGGVVLGADSRTSTGNSIFNNLFPFQINLICDVSI